MFNSEVGDIDAEIKQRRQNLREPQPITFPIDVPLTVSSKIVENIRLHYKAAWGVQATADGEVWRLDFRCHT